MVTPLVGCGSGDDTAAGAETAAQAPSSSVSSSIPQDVCTLLTPPEIAAATGLAWGDGAPNPALSAEGRTVCDWYASGAEYASVQVMIVTSASAFAESRAGAAEVFGLAAGQLSIPGVDDAYQTAEGSLIGMAIDDSFVQVSFIPPGPGEVLSQTRQLAEVVAGRL